MKASERESTTGGELVSAINEQKQRVVGALIEAETLDATPILHDEILSGEQYVTLVYELHHVHLPELQAAGVIEFDRQEDRVARGPRFDETCLHFSNDLEGESE